MSTALAVIVGVTGLLWAVVTAAWGTVALSYWWELRHRRSPAEQPAPVMPAATSLRPSQRTA
ncbi:hypothetical protein [Nocardia salmonicida]|uniref:hypothetical protein n=1 Tax=Nocardia salmonicida TaxID=53431 RepID=UPI00362E0210